MVSETTVANLLRTMHSVVYSSLLSIKVRFGTVWKSGHRTFSSFPIRWFLNAVQRQDCFRKGCIYFIEAICLPKAVLARDKDRNTVAWCSVNKVRWNVRCKKLDLARSIVGILIGSVERSAVIH